MKYMKQFGIIMMITFLGELLHSILPLPVPASIYGLLLLLFALMTGMIQLSQVEDTAKFLIEIMPFMFIPAAVGLIDAWNILSEIWIQVVVTTLVSTIVVMAVSGKVTQWVIGRNNRGGEKEHE